MTLIWGIVYSKKFNLVLSYKTILIMISFLFWLFIKFTLFPAFSFFLSLALVTYILFYSGIPIAKIGMKVETVYLFFVHLIYIYCYGMLGAYFSKIISHYSVDHHLKAKWAFILFSLIALLLFYSETLKELSRQRNKIASSMNVKERIAYRNAYGAFDKELFYNLILVAGLRMVVVSLFGFVVFLIFPSLVEWLYGSLPYTMAKLFH